MTNSREKFDVWVKHHLESLSGWEDFNVTEISHAAWLAGRESMRDEAVEKCANELVRYDTDHEWNVRCAAAEEIKEIQP